MSHDDERDYAEEAANEDQLCRWAVYRAGEGHMDCGLELPCPVHPERDAVGVDPTRDRYQHANGDDICTIPGCEVCS